MKKLLFSIVLLLFSFSYGQTKKNAPCYDLTTVLKVEATPLYQPHLDASRSFKIKLLEDEAAFQKYINKGKLHKVKKKAKGYQMQKLDYSRPYLVSKARIVLEKIGVKFSSETKGSTFTVSSVTRTLEDQCRLRQVNSNASLGISSHNYGNSFDISYVRFDNKLKNNLKLEATLEKVLKFYADLGRIYYIKEKQQSCFHVTVKNY